MGLNWNYSGPDEVYDELSKCMDSMKNITWERLVKDGAVTYPCDGKDKPGNEVIFGEGFPTDSKKGNLYLQNLFLLTSDLTKSFLLYLQLEDSLSIGTPVQ